ncbi:MAG: DUF4143 domain-containing protein [Polyangiaceae bacterium]|nr:DUF4143 domain-containing protein [Polyangiaceae bacterium]
MFRARSLDLDRWADAGPRKPLVVRGARQVGKSWLVLHWGKARFGRVVEANVERHSGIAGCFTHDDPREVLLRLEVLLGQPIPVDGSTLLFLDEIQAAPEILAKLRWFAEELPQLPLIAAGSLLDFALADHSFSMPVGRISYLHLEPMGFCEFALALGEERLVAWLREQVTLDRIASGDAMPNALHQRAQQIFRMWILVGGMPAAVEAYRLGRSLLPVADVHRDLLATIRDDFSKYANRVQHRLLTSVLAAVPAQLGQKFKWSKVEREARAASLRQALELLVLARVCHRVTATSGHGLPLGAGADIRNFKAIYLDVGLASASLHLSLSELEHASDLTLVNSGAIAEQAVGQLLRLNVDAHEEPALWYWLRDHPNSSAEIDYLTTARAKVIPVEVKAGAGGALRSLHLFMAERGSLLAVRFNSAAPVIQEVNALTSDKRQAKYKLLSLPMYLVEELPRLLA